MSAHAISAGRLDTSAAAPRDCDLSLGLTPDFAGLKKELSLWARLRRFPLYATFELTPLCNLRCGMCYVRLNPADAEREGGLRSAAYWLEVGRQARDMGLFFVTLTGGEPLLHPEFQEIYTGLRRLGLLVSVYTNACLIDEDIAAFFREDPPHSIKISIYGASDETYARLCGVPDGFSRATRGMECLREAGVPFYCTTTVVRENRADIPVLYTWTRARGIPYFHTLGVTVSARGADSDPAAARLSVEEEGWTLERLEAERTPEPGVLPFARCGGHGMSFFLTWHGHLQFCGFAATPFVPLPAEAEAIDLPTAWRDMRAQVDAITTPPECADCADKAFCKRCPGLLAAESGDPSRVCESFCRRAAALSRAYAREVEKSLAPSKTS